jgi:DNA-directed RNA polymerase specialized sigma24 family protein
MRLRPGAFTLWRKAASYRPELAAPSTWILTIVHRRAVDIVRREQRRRAGLVEEPEEPATEATDEPSLPGMKTPGAIAANVGFVVATAAGTVAADAAGRPDAFAHGWDAERGRQLAWLTEKLDLDEL